MMSYVFFTADRIFGDELFDSKQFGMDAIIIADGGDVRVAECPAKIERRKVASTSRFAEALLL